MAGETVTTRKAEIAQLAERHPCEVKTPMQFVAPGTTLGPLNGGLFFCSAQIGMNRIAFPRIIMPL